MMKEPFISFVSEGTTGYSTQFSMKTLFSCSEFWITGAILAECVIISADSIPHERALPPMLARLDTFRTFELFSSVALCFARCIVSESHLPCIIFGIPLSSLIGLSALLFYFVNFVLVFVVDSGDVTYVVVFY